MKYEGAPHISTNKFAQWVGLVRLVACWTLPARASPACQGQGQSSLPGSVQLARASPTCQGQGQSSLQGQGELAQGRAKPINAARASQWCHVHSVVPRPVNGARADHQECHQTTFAGRCPVHSLTLCAAPGVQPDHLCNSVCYAFVAG